MEISYKTGYKSILMRECTFDDMTGNTLEVWEVQWETEKAGGR